MNEVQKLIINDKTPHGVGNLDVVCRDFHKQIVADREGKNMRYLVIKPREVAEIERDGQKDTRLPSEREVSRHRDVHRAWASQRKHPGSYVVTNCSCEHDRCEISVWK